MKKEEKIQAAICDYLRAQYPKVIFTCEASGIRVRWNQAKKLRQNRSCNGLPDLIILHPKGDYYHGLLIELKSDDVTIFKRNGEIVADKHIREQFEILKRLRSLDFKAEFACGFDEAKKIIDDYLKN